MRVAVGHSNDPSTQHAAEEVLAAAMTGASRPPDGALVFAAMQYEHAALLERLAIDLTNVPMAGCTTDGELSHVRGFAEDSVVLVLFWDVVATSAIGERLSVALEFGVNQALSGLPAQSAGIGIVLPAGVTVSGSSVVEALAKHAGPNVTLVGATAGDQWAFRETLQFHDWEVHHDSLPILFLSGTFDVSVGIGVGWDPIGDAGRVTSARGNVVHSIDGRPALDFFRRYFGESHHPAPHYPLTVWPEHGRQTLRAPMTYDEQTGDVRFAGDVPEGAEVRLSEASRDLILAGTAHSVDTAMDGRSMDGVVLAFSCAARKHVLGTRTAEEMERIATRIGDCPLAGFYGYGEFVVSNGVGTFYNETLVTVALVPTGATP